MDGQDMHGKQGSLDRLEPDRHRRAAGRRDWAVTIHRLGEEPGDDLSATTTAEERLAMVWPLTVDAWALAGREIPDYSRSEMPVRVIHGYLQGQRKGEP